MDRPRIKISLLLVLLAALTAPAGAGAAGPGDLDPAFGERGVAAAGSVRQFKAQAPAVAVDPLGRVTVVATISTEPPGSSLNSGYHGTQVRISRFLADGSPDRSFGRSGTAALSVGPNGTEVRDVAVTPDGGVAIAGRTTYRADMPFCCAWVADWDFMVARLDERGRLAWVTTRDDGRRGVARAVAVDGAGTVLAGGSSEVRRYREDGRTDDAFGESGLAPLPRRVTDLAVTPAGLLVAGSTGGSPQLARLDGAGGLDASFGDAGIAPLPARPQALAPDGGDGALVLGLRRGNSVLARVGPEGALDESFGSAGRVRLAGTAAAVAADPAGRAVVALAGGRLLRFDSEGAYDATFGARFPALELGSVAVAENGRVLAAGVAKTFDDGGTDWRDRFGPAVARYFSEAAPGAVSPRPAPAERRHGRAGVHTGPVVAAAARAAG